MQNAARQTWIVMGTPTALPSAAPVGVGTSFQVPNAVPSSAATVAVAEELHLVCRWVGRAVRMAAGTQTRKRAAFVVRALVLWLLKRSYVQVAACM